MRALQQNVVLTAGIIALLWLIEAVNLLMGNTWLRYGIHPRDVQTLPDILAAPLLHANVAHLLANTGPLAVLTWLVLLRGIRSFLAATLFIVVLGGLGVWLIAPPFTVTVGASGVIFGYLGALVLWGLVERRFISLLVALIVVVLYGGVLWGLLPGTPGVSWQGHLTGLLAGGAAGKVFARRRSEPQLSAVEKRAREIYASRP